MYVSNYAVALEQQVHWLRRLSGPEGNTYLRAAQPNASDADRARFKEVLVWALTKAEPFFWDTQLARVVAAAAEQLPAGTVLSEANVPTYAGWFWFETPLAVGPEDLARIRAVSWVPVDDADRGGIALQIGWWVELPDFGTVPSAMTAWFVGDALEEGERRRVATDGPLGPRSFAVMRLVAAAFFFLAQRVMDANAERAPGYVRKRLEAQSWTHEPLIRVVQLRRREASDRERNGDASEVNWSCQWVVRGHWRQQYFPSRNAHQPIWITPYVKGPEEKPLKPPRATVFAVVR